MRILIFMLVVGIFFSTTSFSFAASCYSPVQVEAEQGLRIHTELMVIALTCSKMPGGQGLYPKYQKFTEKNSKLLAGYEDTLIDYYAARGSADAEQRLHGLRTRLANEISNRAVSMSVLSFCQSYQPRLDKALAMDNQKLRRWAQQVWPEQPPSIQRCGHS